MLNTGNVMRFKEPFTWDHRYTEARPPAVHTMGQGAAAGAGANALGYYYRRGARANPLRYEKDNERKGAKGRQEARPNRP